MAKAPVKAPVKDDDEQPADDAAAAAKPAKKKLLLLVAIGLVVVGITVGGTIVAIKMLSGDKKEEVAEGEAAGEHAEPAQPEKVQLTYLPMEPAFLTNFVVNGRPRYLQVSLTLATRDKKVLDAVQTHAPLIRNRIVMLLSAEQFDVLRTRAGRDALQLKLQDAVKEVLQKEGAEGELEKVLFTNFVMQ